MKPPKTNDKVHSMHNQASQREASRGPVPPGNALNMSAEFKHKANMMNNTFDSAESPMDNVNHGNGFRYGGRSVQPRGGAVANNMYIYRNENGVE